VLGNAYNLGCDVNSGFFGESKECDCDSWKKEWRIPCIPWLKILIVFFPQFVD
jgi:hypothetical protein